MIVEAVASIAKMPTGVWASLILLVVALVGGTAFVVVRALEAWRALNRLRRALGEGLEALQDRIEGVEQRVARFEQPEPRLQRSLERLARARAMLQIQLRVVQQARAPLTRIRSAVPRK